MGVVLPSDPIEVKQALADDPVGFAARANEALDGANPLTTLRWAHRAFGREIAVTASMGDTVLAHLAGRAVPGIHVIFLDTGYHFAETIGTADAVGATYPIRLRTVGAAQSKAEHEAEHGELFRTDPDRCCALRKVAPLNAALAGYRAWATGLRRDDSPERGDTPTVSWDSRRELLKLAPIAHWSDSEVERYLGEHRDLLTNPLVELGYRSIGCAPCTRAVGEGEDARAGRWAGLGKSECGIHYQI
jgi:phosphoadenosine phosphosulfate reductase